MAEPFTLAEIGLPRVFVLMPFAPEFNQVYTAIKRAADAAGAFARRVDDQVYNSLILQRIYNQIVMADIIVAEMTGRNPNVFYEVGYAHAIGRRVILITQQSADIPFDLSQYPHIIYGGDCALLESELRTRLAHSLGTATFSPLSDDAAVLGKLQFFINDTEITLSGSRVRAPARRVLSNEPRPDDLLQGFGGKFEMRVDINNIDSYTSYHGNAQFSIQTSSRILRMVGKRRDEERVCRRVPAPNGYAFWPDWRLHELEPSEGMSYGAVCYSSEEEWFSDPERLIVHLHFKGHPIRFPVDISPVELSEDKFKAWQHGLSRI